MRRFLILAAVLMLAAAPTIRSAHHPPPNGRHRRHRWAVVDGVATRSSPTRVWSFVTACCSRSERHWRIATYPRRAWVRLQPDETILPGFFDLHAHYAIDLFGEERVDEYTINPIIFLANGITSTFPAGEVDPEGMMGARRRIERGEQIGPRIMSSGPYFGTARPGWRNADWTADRIREEVDTWAAKGARGFKAKGIHRDHLPVLIERAHRYGLTVTAHLDSGSGTSVNPRDAIFMGIDRIEHFMGGDAIVSTRGAYSSLEALDVTRPEVDNIIKLYLQRNVYYDATVTAYGYWYDPKDMRVFKTWMDEQSFLTPHAREVANSRLPRKPNEQFKRIYEVKLKEVKRFYDAGGGG
jgi:hypothetical protein